jgi:hypothetical protein
MDSARRISQPSAVISSCSSVTVHPFDGSGAGRGPGPGRPFSRYLPMKRHREGLLRGTGRPAEIDQPPCPSLHWNPQRSREWRGEESLQPNAEACWGRSVTLPLGQSPHFHEAVAAIQSQGKSALAANGHKVGCEIGSMTIGCFHDCAAPGPHLSPLARADQGGT